MLGEPQGGPGSSSHPSTPGIPIVPKGTCWDLAMIWDSVFGYWKSQLGLGPFQTQELGKGYEHFMPYLCQFHTSTCSWRTIFLALICSMAEAQNTLGMLLALRG